MHMLFTMEEFEKAIPSQKLPLQCEWCKETFYRYKKFVNQTLTSKTLKRHNSHRFCNKQCRSEWQNKIIPEECGNCTKIVFRQRHQKRRSKTGKIFCSQSCSTIYSNAHKITGNRRSKLEKWLEEQLTILYYDLQIIYNGREAINSELDIYIPSLNLAFELNGIFHYEPIYGAEKLASIQNNDSRKFQACLEQGIELVIIDSSSLNYFKPKNAQKYLDIILPIINTKLGVAGGIPTLNPVMGGSF